MITIIVIVIHGNCFLLPSTVPYWNYCKSLICHYNPDTYSVAFSFSRAEL